MAILPTTEFWMKNDARNFACFIFVAVTAVTLQLAIAVAIVMAWGWVAMFGYAFVGTFVNAFASRYCNWKLMP